MKTRILLALAVLAASSAFAQTLPVNNLQVNGSVVAPLTVQTGAINGTSLTINSSPNVNQGATVRLLGNGAVTPGKYVRAFGGNFQVINDANSAALLTIADSGSTTFLGGVTAASFTGLMFPTTPLMVGTSLYPTIVGPVNTTASTTNGVNTITVTNASGIAIGMGIYSGFVSSCTNNGTVFSNAYVTNVSGNTITMSCPAASTNVVPVAVQFGQQRYSTTSTVIANDIGTQTLKVGSASQGNSATWLNQISTGQDYRLTSAAQIVPPPGGGYGITVAARTSDATGGAVAFPMQALFYADSGNPAGSEVGYFQSNLLPATAGKTLHIQFEQTISSQWGTPVTEDPYSINQVNQTINHRLDCGNGGGTGDNNCSTAIDIVPNPQSFVNGIVVADGALLPGGAALSMPVNNQILWYSAANSFSAALSSPSAGIMQLSVPGSGGQFQFLANGNNEFSITPTLTYTKPYTFAAATAIACNSGNEGFEASITDGNTATFNATVAGGGSNHVKIRCNGTNWVVY